MRLGRVDGAAYGVNLSNPSDSYIRKTWEDGYSLIVHLNQGIEAIQRGALDQIQQSVYLGRLLALRAYTYYQLAVLWGNIPYTTDAPSTDNVSAEQLSTEEVMRRCLDETSYSVNIMGGNFGRNFAGIPQSFYLDYDAAKLLLGEIGLTLGDRSLWQNTDGVFAFYDNRVDDRHLPLYLERLRQPEIPVFVDYNTRLLALEAEGSEDASSLAREWLGPAGQQIGVWAALKRLGQAQALTGCKDHELLLPIPASELRSNPNVRQNPGY